MLIYIRDYEGQIPFLPDNSEILQHQLKNISYDIKYKVHVLDYNGKSFIGIYEMNISYEIINKISPLMVSSMCNKKDY